MRCANTQRMKYADIYRLQGNNIGIIGYATEALNDGRRMKNLLIEIIAEAQKSNALINRYDARAHILEQRNNTNQVKLFKDIIAHRR